MQNLLIRFPYFATAYLEGKPEFVALRETKVSIISVVFREDQKESTMCLACVFTQCLVISHHHSHFLSFKSSLPPRLILILTSFISKALVLFSTNCFYLPLSLNSHNTSHQRICLEAHTQGKGRGQKTHMHSLQSPHRKIKFPCLWLWEEKFHPAPAGPGGF